MHLNKVLPLFALGVAAIISPTPTFADQQKSAEKNAASPLVEGLLKLNGKEYRAVCNCNAEHSQFAANSPVCNPSKVKIHEDHAAATGLSVSEVRSLYGQPVDISFGKVVDYHFACMDDRISEPSLFTPGGDLGEFLLGLMVYGTESPGGVSFTEDLVTEYLNKYLRKLPTNRRFYHCTDDAAVSHLERALDMEGLDIAEPAENQRDEIKDAFSEPENIGDIHFRTILRNPSWYHVDSNLPNLVIKAFFNILWDKTNPNREKLILDILPGKRNPKAFLEVTTSEECEKAEIAPLLRPRTKPVSVYISHMASVNARRSEIADFFSKNIAVHGAIPTEQFLSRMDRYGFLWLETTGARIGKDLPFYRLTFV